MTRALVLAALFGVGCGKRYSAPPDAGPLVIVETDAGGVACPSTALAPGDYDRQLSFGGRTRSYHLHVPASYQALKPTPLVLGFHGSGGNALGQETVMHLHDKSEDAGYLVALPEGTGVLSSVLSWNAGNCCAAAERQNVDDVGFVRAMLDAIASEACVDPRRVYATGHSNGAMMTHRLACELSDRIAAISPNAGGIADVELSTGTPSTRYACTPSRPVPVFEAHGLSDTCYPFDGGPGEAAGTFMVSVPVTISGWVARNRADPVPTETFARGTTRCMTHGCDGGTCAEVTLCTITGGGHAWPGSDSYPSQSTCGGQLTTDLAFNDAMWTFFLAHPRP